MSTSAAGGAAGGVRMPHGLSSAAVNKGKVFAAVAGAHLFIYVVWELRMRGSAKAGKLPISMTDEWQLAQTKRFNDAELVSDPSRRVVLNPHRNNVPPQFAVHPAS